MKTALPNSVVRAVRWFGRTVVVDVAGDVDLASSPVLEESLLVVLHERPRRIVVNLSDVSFMGIAGAATLVTLLAHARKVGASVCLAALAERARQVLELCRLVSIFEIQSTVAEAINGSYRKVTVLDVPAAGIRVKVGRRSGHRVLADGIKILVA